MLASLATRLSDLACVARVAHVAKVSDHPNLEILSPTQML